MAAEPRGGAQGACAKLIEVLEPEDLTGYPELASPALRQIGVAVTVRNDANPPRLVVFLMLEGGGCRPQGSGAAPPHGGG